MKIQEVISKIKEVIIEGIKVRKIKLEFIYDNTTSKNSLECVIFYSYKGNEEKNFTAYLTREEIVAAGLLIKCLQTGTKVKQNDTGVHFLDDKDFSIAYMRIEDYNLVQSYLIKTHFNKKIEQ